MANSRIWYGWADYALPDPATSATTLAKSILWATAAALLGNATGTSVSPNGSIPAGGLWTHYSSSDGVTFGIDSTNRWLVSYNGSKIVRASSGAHSHITLYSAALGLWLTIDWLSGSDAACNYWLATVAPTGGSTSLRPTSTNEVGWAAAHTFCDTSLWAGGRAHYAVDASGNFYFFASQNGTGLIQCVTAVQTLNNLRTSGDAFPAVLINQFDVAGCLREAGGSFFRGYGASAANVPIRTKTYNAGAASDATVIQYNIGNNSSVVTTQNGSNYADNLYDEWPLVVCTTSAGTVGPKGELPDVSNVAPNLSNGVRFPTAGTIERIVCGSSAVPLTNVPTL